ncbi:MAG: hypothetical protein IJ632_07295, partial [Muribaculaceae bacterium]|nr:hypothetical protein [Muribaculaceae bacterium]
TIIVKICLSAATFPLVERSYKCAWTTSTDNDNLKHTLRDEKDCIFDDYGLSRDFSKLWQ